MSKLGLPLPRIISSFVPVYLGALRGPGTSLTSRTITRRRANRRFFATRARAGNTETEGSQQISRSWRNKFRPFRIISVLCGLYLITYHVVTITPCWGLSMYPTIRPWDRLLFISPWLPGLSAFAEWKGKDTDENGSYSINQQGNQKGEPKKKKKTIPANIQRGDLLVYSSPIHPNEQVVKRVAGLEGDVVAIDPPKRQPSSPSPSKLESLDQQTEWFVVPQGHVWMLGDNQEMSRDSRHYGPVQVALVKGKAVARVWPWRSLRNNAPGAWDEVELSSG